MSRRNKVLAITKRTAELCATQSLLYAAGFELVTATNVVAARALIRALPVCGLIICEHSWTEAERAQIASVLASFSLPVMNCPGCTGCDENCGKAGTLNDMVPLTKLISTFGQAPL